MQNLVKLELDLKRSDNLEISDMIKNMPYSEWKAKE